MNVTLHQLQVFVRIAELGSVTKAAASLHLSQPAVSVHLRNLQGQFEVPLTEAVGRRIRITDFGRDIAASAANILAEIELVGQKAQAYQGLLTGSLRLAIASTGKYVMPYFLSDFMRAHPGVNLQMDVTNRAEVLRQLGAQDIDFALVSLPPENLDFEQIDLMPNELHLVGNSELVAQLKETASAKTASAKTPYDPTTLFADLPLIYREPGSGTRRTMERFFEDRELSVVKKMELTSNEAVKQAVLAGLGFSVMPVIGLRERLESGALEIVPVEGLPVTSLWRLVWLKGRTFSPVAAAYLGWLREHKAGVMAEHFGGVG